MKKAAVGIIAHVDAGKTTLAEAMLYKAGAIRKQGRVDNGDTIMDTHILERERGITIFAGQAVFTHNGTEITLLDTPGHVDFSAETERILDVLDYAILVISGTDGVQSHTRTLWKLLKHYNVPTFIFITKNDLARRERAELIAELKKYCGDCCIDFSTDCTDEMNEQLAVCREDVLEKYLDGVMPDTDTVASLIKSRLAVPCFFGSGLKNEGIDEFLDALSLYVRESEHPSEFGAKVFKISRDERGERLVHLKITGGSLKVKSTVNINGVEEKINSLRIYSGTKYAAADEASAGTVCAVTGLNSAQSGDGLGTEKSRGKAYLEPVMSYRVVLPDDCDPKQFMPKLKLLEEEDPMLRVSWNTHLQEINVALMGEIQAEILKALVLQRFDVKIETDRGRVMYKETIENTVEGVGHYEPLRHYAEVHLLMEPMPTGSGLQFAARCSEDSLDRNWQRLILMHLAEKQHLGVLTGSPVTDMKITLMAGRAHLKHTEGGDFRQATYRAVRHGLMQAQSKLLEPYYDFRLEVPTELIGRAISDIKMRHGTFEAPQDTGGFSVLTGTAPVTALNGYSSEVAAYTGGNGRLFCELSGYGECHDPDEIIAGYGYDAEGDLENTPDSVFCAHGGGFNVKWDKVTEYMHLESCLKKKATDTVGVNARNFHIDDKELEAIMEREFGKDKHPFYRWSHTAPRVEEKHVYTEKERRKYIIIDGYNVIFAWESLKDLAEYDLETARTRLLNIMCDFSAFTQCNVIVVFDAYKVPGNRGKSYTYNNIGVVFTKERETGDAYIEKTVAEIGKNENVCVVTSDNLIRLSALRAGVLKIKAQDFEKEVIASHGKMEKFLEELNRPRNAKIGEFVSFTDE